MKSQYFVVYITAIDDDYDFDFWGTGLMDDNPFLKRAHGIMYFSCYPIRSTKPGPTTEDKHIWFSNTICKIPKGRFVFILDFDDFSTNEALQLNTNAYINACAERFDDFTYSVIVQKMKDSKVEFDEAFFNEKVTVKCSRFVISERLDFVDPSILDFIDGAEDAKMKDQYRYVPISFDSLVTPAPKPELEFRKAYQDLDAQQLLNMDQTRLVLCLPNPGDIDYIQKALQRSGEELSDEYNIFIFP
ncbi:hypothetical protein HDV02_005141, partial [Globomyces sp. JEL0801]